MIVIVSLLLVSLYLFWFFDKRRKMRKAEHERAKRDAFTRLLTHLRKKKENEENNTKKSDEHES